MLYLNRIYPIARLLIKNQTKILKHSQYQINRRFNISHSCFSDEKLVIILYKIYKSNVTYELPILIFIYIYYQKVIYKIIVISILLFIN